MRLSFAVALFAAYQAVSGFAPLRATRWSISVQNPSFRSTMEAEETTVSEVEAVEISLSNALRDEVVPLSEAEINARLSMQLEKLQAKDSTSTQLSKEVSRKL